MDPPDGLGSRDFTKFFRFPFRGKSPEGLLRACQGFFLAKDVNTLIPDHGVKERLDGTVLIGKAVVFPEPDKTVLDQVFSFIFLVQVAIGKKAKRGIVFPEEEVE